jgi:hypothetical protein
MGQNQARPDLPPDRHRTLGGYPLAGGCAMSIVKLLKDRIQGKAPKGAKRSSGWRNVRKQYLKDNPGCAVCGSTSKVEVHHKVPFHLAPDKELDPDNLMTLCENKKYGINCHLLIGHLGNYQKLNVNVDLDAMTWSVKLKDG